MSNTRALFSPLWYRVQAVAPRLKKHARIHRHVYRGQLWYVLQDRLGNRYHRISPAAYWFTMQLDGRRSVGEIWEGAVVKFAEQAPTQQETLKLLAQLHGADLLSSNVPPDLLEILQRHSEQERSRWRQRLTSPLAIKIPLFDPDRLLNATQVWVRWCFTGWGFCAWLALVGYAFLLVGQHWSELTHNVSDQVLTPTNLLLLAIAFPVIKALHELGHAYATKIWGGEVHEMGIMLLVFMPVPYVDASAANAIRERHRRVVVGAAGMMVELLLAALAMLYWVGAEPGLAKSLAYNIMFIAGISTVLFNANPLLRFDGYYILADWLEIPNLASRAQHYYGYLTRKYGLRLTGESPPPLAAGERWWFLFYGVTSYFYRVVVVVAIALFIASKFFILGVLLAVWSLFNVLVLPLLKAAAFLHNDERVQRRAARTYAAVAGAVMTAIVVIGWVPFPYWTNAQGVMWLPEEALVRAGTDCFVTELLTQNGASVAVGQPLIRCVDPLLESDIKVKQAVVDEQEIRYFAARRESPLTAELAAAALASARAELHRAEEKLHQQLIVSHLAGSLEIPSPRDLPQRYVHKGEVVAYVIAQRSPDIRAVVTQKHAALVRQDTTHIEVRRLNQLAEVLPADLLREVPGASDQLPVAALGTAGGGEIAVDPRDVEGLRAFHKVFQFDVRLQQPLAARFFRDRVALRFHHHPQTLWQRWGTDLRLLILDRFGV